MLHHLLPLRHIERRPLPDEKRHNDPEQVFDAREPSVGLLPAFGAHGLVDRDFATDFLSVERGSLLQAFDEAEDLAAGG